MNVNKVSMDINELKVFCKLCEQITDIENVVNEVKNTEVNITSNAYGNIVKFVDRIDSILNYAQSILNDFMDQKINEEFVNDKMISMMHKLVEYKNSYKVGGLAHRTMNSLLDIATETFVDINKN